MGSRGALSSVRHLKTFSDIQRWLGMSLTEMGRALGVSRGTISDIKAGRSALSQERLDTICGIIVNRLARDLGRDDIGIKYYSFDHQITLSVMARCRQCGRWFYLPHPNTRRCPECRGQQQQQQSLV